MKTSAVMVLLLSSTLAYGQKYGQKCHPCSAHAIQQAKALLVFHSGAAANLGVDDSCKLLAPLRNPVNPQQSFDVLEVQGYVYRANYSMRLIYAQIPGACTLIGQEIIERSSR